MTLRIIKSLHQLLLTFLILLFTLPAFGKNTILIVGDSLSAGYGLQANESWVALLMAHLSENKLDFTVVNSSISGDTTSNGLAKLPTLLAQHEPLVTIIELGGNDGLRGLKLPTIQKNLQKMIDLAQQSGSKIVLVGVRLPPNYGKPYIEQFQGMFRTLAAENNITLVPNLLQGVDDNKPLMNEDGIHPRAIAQPIIFDTIWKKLEPLLKQ